MSTPSPLASELPDELLVHVFKHAYALAPLHKPPFAFTISQVSHKWRQLAVNTSSLWSIIVLNHSIKPDILSLILARNHSALFDLYIDLRPPNPSISRAVIKRRVWDHLLVLHGLSARWRVLSVLTDTDDDTVNLLATFKELSSPQLTAFEVHVERHTRAEFPVAPIVRLFEGGAERLRVIDLDGLPLRAAWPPLSDVHTLSLDLSCTSMTCADFVRALEEMPRLQSLTIDNYNFDLPPLPTGSDDTRVHFHSPTLLELSVVSLRSDEDFIARFWSLISFPALATLSLTCHNDEDIHVFAQYAQFPALRALTISHVQGVDHIGELADALPLLEELSVQWCSPEAILYEILSTDLSEPGESGRDSEPSWPHLHTLSLSNFEGPVLALLENIIERKKGTPWPLRKLKVAAMDLNQLSGRDRFEPLGVTVEVIN